MKAPARGAGPAPRSGRGESGRGEYVPLSVAKFRRAYALLVAGSNGEAPPEPDLTYRDVTTGEAVPLDDTPFNRAWVAAGKLFEDEAKRESFYRRVEMMTEVAEPKYLKYLGGDVGSMHGALALTIATVPFNVDTTKKTLKAAFDAEFERHLARIVDLSDSDTHGLRRH